jgi:hypothetical protein
MRDRRRRRELFDDVGDEDFWWERV